MYLLGGFVGGGVGPTLNNFNMVSVAATLSSFLLNICLVPLKHLTRKTPNPKGRHGYPLKPLTLTPNPKGRHDYPRTRRTKKSDFWLEEKTP